MQGQLNDLMVRTRPDGSANNEWAGRSEAIPAPVRRYLDWACAEGNRHITGVRLRHDGRLRTRLTGPWYPIEGTMLLRPDLPERIWTGTIKPYPLVRVTARDSYQNGAGRMLVQAYSRFTLADVTGPEMDASALVTVLAELPQAPTAMAPSERLSWQVIDENSARATLRDGALSVSGVFGFGPLGEPLRFHTEDRYRQVGKTAVLTPWVVTYHGFHRMDGWNLPREYEGAWQLDDSVMPYARFETTSIQFETVAG